MVKVKSILVAIAFCLSSLVFCQWNDSSWEKVTYKDLLEYTQRLNGSFSSTSQNLEEPYFDKVFYNALRIKQVDESIWIYMEQGNNIKTPYRQRIYSVSIKNDSTLTTKYYKLKNPSKFLFYLYDFKVELLESLMELTYKDLIYLTGCDSEIHKGADGNFYSKNDKSICGGSYNGAVYTTSEFRLYKNLIVSWERGWKADGTQAWGSRRGFYYFRRTHNLQYEFFEF